MTSLIIVDIQNDYFPGGKMELTGSLEAAQHAQTALAAFRRKSLPVFYLQHISNREGAGFFLPDTAGVNIHEQVKPLVSEKVIQKNYPNSFRDTALLAELKSAEVNHLVICGMMTHMCIDATTRAAYDLGFGCTVLHDACATRDLVFQDQTIPASQVHAAFLAALKGIYAEVIGTEDYVKQLS